MEPKTRADLLSLAHEVGRRELDVPPEAAAQGITAMRIRDYDEINELRQLAASVTDSEPGSYTIT